jgi:hypothetical protein
MTSLEGKNFSAADIKSEYRDGIDVQFDYLPYIRFLKKAGMKKFILSISLLAVTLCITAQQNTMQQKLLRHVVLFSFKTGSTPEQIKAVETAFAALPQKIKQIKSFEWGTNNSPENLDQGFTHCFFVSFASEEDRAIYLPHPDHKAFGEVLKPVLDKVLVIDYWTN